MKGSENERREGRGIGEQFHEETRYTAERIGYALDWLRMPDPYKNYASPIATIALPAPLTGALYPIETYVLARAVEGLEQGIITSGPACSTWSLSRPAALRPVLAEADPEGVPEGGKGVEGVRHEVHLAADPLSDGMDAAGSIRLILLVGRVGFEPTTS